METPIAEPSGAASPLLTEAQCHHVLVIALAYARRYGMPGEEAEDRALDFLLHLLLHPETLPLAEGSPALSPAWLARCADNWMQNARRSAVRRKRRETDWHNAEGNFPVDPAAEEPLPEVRAVRQEFQARIRAGVARLVPSQQALFAGYVEEESSASELALETGRTANAVHQAVWAMRRRLRQVLAEAGMDETEVEEYLSLSRQYRRPACRQSDSASDFSSSKRE